MAFQKGEKYRCPDPNGDCEIEVTKGAQPGAGGNLNPSAVTFLTARPKNAGLTASSRLTIGTGCPPSG